MTTILLQCVPDQRKVGAEFNKGSAAIFISCVDSLRQRIPGAKFVTFVKLTKPFAEQNGIHVIQDKALTYKGVSFWELWKQCLTFTCVLLWAMLNKCLRINAQFLINTAKLKILREADIVVDISMDRYQDTAGGIVHILPVLETSIAILTELLLGKPVVMYAQTIGPFRHRLSSRLAGFVLNRVSLITLREAISFKNLDELRVNHTPMHVTADPAFLLKPASESDVDRILSSYGITRGKPLIGITVPGSGELFGTAKSQYSRWKRIVRAAYLFLSYCMPDKFLSVIVRLAYKTRCYEEVKYVNEQSEVGFVSQMADRLAEEMGATVVLIPSVILPKDYKPPTKDDIARALAVREQAVHKEQIVVLNGEYSANEVKGFIGRCDMFISVGKLHPYIFATSQCIPSLLIGVTQKFRGIAALLGQEKWRCDALSVDEIMTKVDEAWSQRQQTRQELKEKMKDIRKQAFFNAELVEKIIAGDGDISNQK